MSRLSLNLKKFGRLYPKEGIWLEDVESKKLEELDGEAFCRGLNLSGVEQVLIYGVGNGELFFALSGWLREKRGRLAVFIEDDLAVLRGVLEAELGVRMLREERVQLHFYGKGEDNERLIHRLRWQSLGKVSLCVMDPRYDKEAFIVFRDRMQYEKEQVQWLAEEYKTLGVGYYHNFYQNLKCLPGSFEGAALFGKGEGIPAIIVGAGPSLNKNGHLLKNVGNKGLILAGGSSLPALKKWGVKPHFGAGIDPNIWQCERLKEYGRVDFPYLFRLRVNADALRLVEGQRLYLPGAGGYETAFWLDRKLHLLEADVQEGFNVINLLTDIALKMGCWPIVFVGLDLAYTNGEAYAQGVKWPSRVPKDITEGVDIYGRPLITRWLWLKESHWLSLYASDEGTERFINATEGGIGVTGVKNQPLQEVLDASFTSDMVKEELFNFKEIKISLQDITQEVLILKVSLQKLMQMFDEMELFYGKEMEKGFRAEEVSKEEALWTLRLSEEPAFEAIIKPYDEYCLQLIIHSPLFFRIERDGLNRKRSAQVVRLHKNRIKYLKNVASVHLEMIDTLYLGG